MSSGHLMRIHSPEFQAMADRVLEVTALTSRLNVLPFDDDAVRAPATADPGSSRRIDVERAVARLSRRQRTAIDCVYFVGLSIAETAAVMRCAEGTVKSTLADARARLRTLLEVAP